MYEDYITKLATIMTDYSIPLQGGEFVVILGSTQTIPLVEALYEAALERGAYPAYFLGIPGLDELYLSRGNDEQLQFVNPAMKAVIENADVQYTIMAPSNTKGLTSVDPSRLALRQKSQAPLFETFMRRHGEGTMRWCGMPFPTEALAQEAEMGIHAYRQFVYEACGFHLEDPVAYWSEMRDTQTKLATFLADKSHAELKGPGIDLSFDFKDRVWVSCHGTVNFPDGEIFTGPIEDSVNGHVAFNLRTMYGGREVNGVKLMFKDGVVVEASADKNEDYLLSQLDMDEGARRLGEFAIGTNFNIQRVTGSTLFDEKIGGTIHMALGRSIPDSLGVNQSAIHWDMVHDMKDGGEIRIDGELIYQNGRFLLD